MPVRLALALAAVALVAAPAPSQASLQGVDPHDFVGRVTNPWFPLLPGTTYVYRGIKDGHPARDVVTVTHETKVIAGVHATVVRDRLYLSGRLEERTADWYAQDKHGNVWYLGESTAELDRQGHVTNTEGSWLTGAHGAQPGIYMPAHPRLGQSGRQEFYRGHAEDHFSMLDTSASVTIPFVRSRHALLTKEWRPLEPGVIDHKYYVRGIGTVKERTVKGGVESAVLVSLKRP